MTHLIRRPDGDIVDGYDDIALAYSDDADSGAEADDFETNNAESGEGTEINHNYCSARKSRKSAQSNLKLVACLLMTEVCLHFPALVPFDRGLAGLHTYLGGETPY